MNIFIYSEIIAFIYMLVGVFFRVPKQISIPVVGLFILTTGWFWLQIIKKRISFSFSIKKYSIDVKVLGVFFVYELLLFCYYVFQSDASNETYNLSMVVFLCCFLWEYVNKNEEKGTRLFDGIMHAGVIVTGTMLFAYVGNENEIEWLANLTSDKAIVASWMLLFSLVGILAYCFCEEKSKALFYFFSTVLSFLILCINHYCVSFWLLILVFLLIPVLFRPRAELIKRNMQLLFVFLFMLSNLSLLTNYTNFLLIEVELSQESSVYLEMLLAVGTIIFFHYWDRLPEEANLNKVSMLKLQRVFVYACGFVIFVFVGIIFGGNGWNDLPDTMSGKMIKSAVIPIIHEVAQYRSGFSMLIEHQGIVGTMLFLVVIGMIFKKAIGNYHKDKQMVTSYLLVWILFVGQILFFMPAINVIPVYFIFFLYSACMKERKKEVIVIKNKVEEL